MFEKIIVEILSQTFPYIFLATRCVSNILESVVLATKMLAVTSQDP